MLVDISIKTIYNRYVVDEKSYAQGGFTYEM